MKILQVIDSLGIGGAEQVLTVLMPALKKRGHDVVVAVRTEPLELEALLVRAGVPVVQLAPRHKWNLLGSALNIARVAREHNVQIIHAHFYFPAQAVALVKLLRLYRCVTVVTFHNLAYAHGVNSSGLGLSVKKLLARVLCRFGFDQKIAVSSAVAAHYKTALGLAEIDVIHNPVDVTAVDAVAAVAPAAPKGPLHIVVPGRLVHEKGHLDFLDALTVLPAQSQTFAVTFAGDGNLRQTLEGRVAELGLDGLIHFAGGLEHVELLRVVASADIVVIPSRFEGFGLTAIEAMALAKPVIVCAVGGLLEIVEHEVSGLVVPVADPHQLALALERLITRSAERDDFGEGGRRRVEEQFSLPIIANQLQRLYTDSLSLAAANAQQQRH